MPITTKQKRWLKQQTHHLKPVVTVGQHGLTDAVLAELEQALAHHELLKVKVSAGDRTERDAAITEICEHTGALLIGRIGHIASFYRHNPRKRDPLALQDG
ncbi:RNA-binding protein [Thiocapsa imhoffii]|uniref:RNA-binding protein n=1 Tax=Thiocapsa imhoffii TaxID=382777 RepID=A0A9X1B939_9GAMM|nr:ribosome assembly RNA-binding protein YhbY [Thiocapsa imhoffii]MBK1644646.1 RNA-binding protein [Thiocapsa imhoffii]